MKNLWIVPLIAMLVSVNTVWGQNDLDGEWSIISGQMSGTPVATESTAQMSLKITSTKFEAKSGDMVSTGIITSVEGSNPTQATFKIESGADAGREIKAIYRKQSGGFRIAFSQDNEFPVSFASNGQNQYLVLNYKNAKADVASRRRGGRKKPPTFKLGQPQFRSN